MEHVTLVRLGFMGTNTISVVLLTVRMASVLSSQESVMTVKIDSLEKTVITHAISVSMVNVTNRMVSAKKVTKVVSVVIIAMKLALIGAKTVVTRQMRTVYLVKMGFMGMNVPMHAQ